MGNDGSKAAGIVKVLSYYSLLLTLALLLVAGDLLVAPVSALLLVWCILRKFPLRPRLPDKGFTATERRVWFRGGAVAIATAIAISRLMLEGGVLQLIRYAGLASACWAFVFLAYRDVRRVCAGDIREGQTLGAGAAGVNGDADRRIA